jgi:cytochrome c oxidase subunit 2
VKVGPSLKGIWGRTESLDDGTTVEIKGPEGETYLADSILYPNKHIVKGHDRPSKMNAFQLNSQQLDSIIDYLKTLK